MKHGSPSPTAATNPVPFCWPSWYPSHPDLRTDAGNYSYYCGFFVADAQDMAAHKNAGGYYFTFSSKVQQYQDGWCVPVQDKTYLCYLLNGSTKDNNIHYS